MDSKFITTIIVSAVIGLLFVLLLVPSKKPYIVVNMPADAKPLANLPPNTKVINNDRAILWWTVFKHMSDRGYSNTAVDCANAAVKSAYPEPK